MRILDLFSGIGGVSLAAEWMGWETVAFCERDPFCQKVLRKHWPNTLIYDDINTLPSEFIRDSFKPNLITGGFPCQPFSTAGTRAGKNDDRYLWPAMLKVIATVRPTWIVAENVTGIITLALDDVLSDLEGEGYATQAVVIPACATGAPHRRDRVWIIAHCGVGNNATSIRRDRHQQITGCVSEGEREGRVCESSRSGETSPNANSRTSTTLRPHEDQGRATESLERGRGFIANTDNPRTQGRTQAGNAGSDGAQSDDQYARRCNLASPSHADSQWQLQPQGVVCEIGRRLGNASEDARHTASEGLPDWAGGTFRQPSPLTEFERSGSDGKEREIERYFRTLDARIPAQLVRSGLEVDTHSIMGFILTLRRIYYGSKNENSRAELRILREVIGQENIQWETRGLHEIFEKTVLRCVVHGEVANEGESCSDGIPSTGKEASQRGLRAVQFNESIACSPQGLGYNKQCSCEFDYALRVLSSQMALAEREVRHEAIKETLQRMWQTCRSERVLPEPLSALSEVWRSAFNEEIRAIRWDSHQGELFIESARLVRDRVSKLKALGNAIVPQVAYEIFRAIESAEKSIADRR